MSCANFECDQSAFLFSCKGFYTSADWSGDMPFFILAFDRVCLKMWDGSSAGYVNIILGACELGVLDKWAAANMTLSAATSSKRSGADDHEQSSLKRFRRYVQLPQGAGKWCALLLQSVGPVTV